MVCVHTEVNVGNVVLFTRQCESHAMVSRLETLTIHKKNGTTLPRYIPKGTVQ